MVSRELIWRSFRLSICIHGVKGTHCKCLVNRLFVSIVSRVLIGGVSSIYLHGRIDKPIVSVLSIVYLSPWCQGYSLEEYYQLSICLNGLIDVPIVSVLSIVYLSQWCQGYSLGVSCQLSISIHGVKGTHCKCLVNCLFVSIVSRVLIGRVLSICLHGVKGTHWKCLVNLLFVSMVSRVLIGRVLSIVYLSPWSHGYTHWGCLVNRLFASMVSWIYPLGVSCQSSICLHYATGTHWECIVYRLFVSMVSWIYPLGVSWLLNGSVLSFVYLSPWCQWYSLGVSIVYRPQYMA